MLIITPVQYYVFVYYVIARSFRVCFQADNGIS